MPNASEEAQPFVLVLRPGPGMDLRAKLVAFVRSCVLVFLRALVVHAPGLETRQGGAEPGQGDVRRAQANRARPAKDDLAHTSTHRAPRAGSLCAHAGPDVLETNRT